MLRFINRAVLPAITVLVVLVPSAFAARTGQAPIDAPRRIDSSHAKFRVLGSGWLQPVRAESGAPLFGGYSRELQLEEGECRMFVGVRATGTRVYPSVGKRTVRLRPGIEDELLRFDHRGKHGNLRWWSGKQEGEVAAGAVERAPRALRKRGLRWVVYRLDVSSTVSDLAIEAACRERAQRLGAPVLRGIARSLHVVRGAATAEPPYVEVTST